MIQATEQPEVHLVIDFHYERVGANQDIVSIVLSGELDQIGSDYLLQCVERQIEDECNRIVLDCEQLTYISSLGLGMLIRVHSRMKKRGGDVKLAAVHGTVADLLRLVRLDKILEIYPTVPEAVAAHGG